MDIDHLKRRRGGHRARATMLINALDTALSTTPLERSVVIWNSTELERQKSSILQLDANILDLATEEAAMTAEILESSESIMKIDLILQRVSATLNQPRIEDRQASPRVVDAKNVKLPNLVLHKFSGDPLNWLKFWDLFRTSVHERTDLPAPVKFQYLVAQLEDEAEQLIAGFNLAEEEYEEAIDLLKSTYGQKKLLVQARLNAIFDMESPIATVKSLSDFRSTFEGHLRVLKTLCMDVDQSGYVYAHLLLRKLPVTTRDNLNRAKQIEVWTLTELRESIKQEIQHLLSIDDQQTAISKDVSSNSLPSLHSGSFQVSTKTSSSFMCRLCQNEHLTHNCTVYKDKESRKKRVLELKLCINCLRAHHFVSNCTNAARCKTCSKKHHTILCGTAESKSSRSSKSDDPSA